jgi:hypothetical protein
MEIKNILFLLGNFYTDLIQLIIDFLFDQKSISYLNILKLYITSAVIHI